MIRHQPGGQRTGGQFAIDPKPETGVLLPVPDPGRLTSSAGQPDYHFPRHGERRDALTAFNDDEGTYTIGDDLHVSFRGAPHWIDRALPVLAQLHRAGFVGDAKARSNAWECNEKWDLELRTPSGSVLRAEVGQAMDRPTWVSIGCSSSTQGPSVTATSESAGVDQADLNALVRDALVARAIETRWTAAARAASTSPFDVGTIVVHGTGADRYLALDPRIGRYTTVVRLNGAGAVADVVEVECYDRDSLWQATTGRLSAPRTSRSARANLGRRIGLGRRAGVPEQVDHLLGQALDPSTSKDLAWLDANLAVAA